VNNTEWNGIINIDEVKYIRIILSPNLVACSCI
jgi:hypothetical protein